MKISVVSGSHRKKSQSRKISDVVCNYLAEHQSVTQSVVIDLSLIELPLWEEAIWENDPAWINRLSALSKVLQESDGFVIVSPEWHGMVPSALKNFFLMWGEGQLAHKPALIVSISSSNGGSYPVAELRMSSYKNNRICYIPEHLIIRNVETIFNKDPQENDAEVQHDLNKRMLYCIQLLICYAEGFKPIRQKKATDISTFKFGM